MLTFESNKDSEQLEVHGDSEGLLKLARILTEIAEQKASEPVFVNEVVASIN